MYRAGGPVKRLPFCNQRMRFCFSELSRIGKFRSYLFVTIEPGEICFVTHQDKHLLAALFAFFRRHENTHAWRSCGKFAVVTIKIFCVREFVWRANGVP